MRLKDGETCLEAYKRACPDRYAKSKSSRKRYQDDLAGKLAKRPEVKEYAEKFKAEIKKGIEELAEKKLEDEILTRYQYWVFQTKIIKSFMSDEGKYTEQMYMHVSKCFLEKFKDERAEQLEKEAENKKPNLCFNDDLPEDD